MISNDLISNNNLNEPVDLNRNCFALRLSIILKHENVT